MSDSTELAVTEQPQQLITIEPKKYVELVFEPFAKQFEEAKKAVREVEYDIATTSGMNTAIKWRATFRDLRVASEKARKLRKAPILEIGKLLDSRAGEIEATLLPLETMFDEEIKEQEARKEAEKAAKLAAEQQRIADIRSQIDVFRNAPAEMVGKSAQQIGVCADHLSEFVISLGSFMEFAGECQVERDHAVKKLREMQAAQLAVEDEYQRLKAEREEMELKRLELAAAERQAEAARAEREAAEREARRIADEEQRLIQERAAAAMRQQQAEHETRMAAERAELARQQAEIAAAKAEVERTERERLAAIEAEARANREAEEAEAARIAQAEADRIFAEEEQRRQQAAEEAAMVEVARLADLAEKARREQIQFEKHGPAAEEILSLLADHWDVEQSVARHWLAIHNWHALEKAA